MSRLETCHVAVSIKDGNRDRSYKEIKGEYQYSEICQSLLNGILKARTESTSESESHGWNGHRDD